MRACFMPALLLRQPGFERRETVGENTYPVAGAQRDAGVGRADKDRVAGIEGGEFA